MRHLPARVAAGSMIAGAALLVAACDRGGESAAGNLTDNGIGNELTLEGPGNDASAMEAAAQAAPSEPAPAANAANSSGAGGNETDPLGDTSGGDTGGNTIQSNVSGM